MSKTIKDYVYKSFELYKDARLQLESTWLESWAEYAGTTAAVSWLRHNQFHTERNRDNPNDQEWKHRVHTGKAHESVELIWSYFMQASFPSQNWFEIEPVKDLDDLEGINLLKRFYRHQLECSNFKQVYGDALRQLLITGSTCIHVSMCSHSKKPRFDVIDNFNYYTDPTKPASETSFIRRYLVPRSYIKKMVKAGKWEGMSIAKVNKLSIHSIDTDDTELDQVSHFAGIRTDEVREYGPDDLIQILEYWGPLYENDEMIGQGTAIVCHEGTLHYKVTKQRRPYIVANFISMLNRSWGISTLTANLGLLHVDRSFTNARLDNLLATCHNMWEVIEEGVVDPEFKFYPGAKIPVRERGSINPVPIGQSNIALTYQEEANLQARIDRNMGTIPSVGSGPQRKAERVTAQEIQAAQDAGGTRLNQYHSHIERTLVNPTLQMFHQLWKSVPGYVKTVLSNEDGEYGEYQIKPSEFCCCDVNFKIKGSEAVLTSSSKVTRFVEFLNLVLANELLTQKVNIDYIMEQIVYLWGFDEPEKVLQVEEPDPMEQAAPQDAMLDQLDQVDSPTANVVESQMMADGGAQLAQNLAGLQNGQGTASPSLGGGTPPGLTGAI